MPTTEMLLLGAGASVDAGVPAAVPMTRQVAEAFRQDPNLRRYSELISFVIGALAAQKGVAGDDPLGGIDIESLYNAVYSLVQRDAREPGPFVGTWHAKVSDFDRYNPVRARLDGVKERLYGHVVADVAGGRTHVPLDQAVRAIVGPRLSGTRSSDEAIERIVALMAAGRQHILAVLHGQVRGSIEMSHEFGVAVDPYWGAAQEGLFYEEANALIVQTILPWLWITDASRVQYLRPIADLSKRQGSLVVSTLNYDNGIELISENVGVACSSGIDVWNQGGSFPVAQPGINLLKLHGSVNWAWERPAPAANMPSSKTISGLSNADVVSWQHEPAIIFGERNKLTAAGPFLSLLAAFEQALASADRLTAVGYSFRDPHVNEYVTRWLRGDAARRLRIINRGFNTSSVPYVQALRRECAARIDVIEEYAAVGLQQL